MAISKINAESFSKYEGVKPSKSGEVNATDKALMEKGKIQGETNVTKVSNESINALANTSTSEILGKATSAIDVNLTKAAAADKED